MLVTIVLLSIHHSQFIIHYSLLLLKKESILGISFLIILFATTKNRLIFALAEKQFLRSLAVVGVLVKGQENWSGSSVG